MKSIACLLGPSYASLEAQSVVSSWVMPHSKATGTGAVVTFISNGVYLIAGHGPRAAGRQSGNVPCRISRPDSPPQQTRSPESGSPLKVAPP